MLFLRSIRGEHALAQRVVDRFAADGGGERRGGQAGDEHREGAVRAPRHFDRQGRAGQGARTTAVNMAAMPTTANVVGDKSHAG